MENERKRLKFEVLLERFFTNFHRILLTNLIFAVPSALLFTGVYFLNSALFKGAVSIPLSLLVIIPLSPFYAGVVLVCRNIARGDSDVKVFSEFWHAVRSNFLPFLLHGVLAYVAVLLSYLSLSLYINMLSVSWLFYVLLFCCILIVLFVLYAFFYIPLMSITYDLPLRYVYKNSFLMSFGEFKNNFFATLAVAAVFGICLTITAFIRSATALMITVASLWALIIPATVTFMIVFFIYDGMTSIIRDKDDISRKIGESIEKKLSENKMDGSTDDGEDEFSDIDISSLKNTDDYIFHNGRMVKQSALLKMINEREQLKNNSKSDNE